MDLNFGQSNKMEQKLMNGESINERLYYESPSSAYHLKKGTHIIDKITLTWQCMPS